MSKREELFNRFMDFKSDFANLVQFEAGVVQNPGEPYLHSDIAMFEGDAIARIKKITESYCQLIRETATSLRSE